MVFMMAVRDVLCDVLQPARHVGCTRWAASSPTSRQPNCRCTNNVTLPRLQLQHSGRCRCDVWPVSLVPPPKSLPAARDGPGCDVAFWLKADMTLCSANVRF